MALKKFGVAMELCAEAMGKLGDALRDSFGYPADERFTMEMTADEVEEWLKQG